MTESLLRRPEYIQDLERFARSLYERREALRAAIRSAAEAPDEEALHEAAFDLLTRHRESRLLGLLLQLDEEEGRQALILQGGLQAEEAAAAQAVVQELEASPALIEALAVVDSTRFVLREGRKQEAQDWHEERRRARAERPQDDLLARVMRACRLREEGRARDLQMTPREVRPPVRAYAEVSFSEMGRRRTYALCAVRGAVDMAFLTLFCAEVHARYLAMDTNAVSQIVYDGVPPDDKTQELAQAQGVYLVSLDEYQALIDFGPYLLRQIERLEQDRVYPPALYVDQRLKYAQGGAEQRADNALATVTEWLLQPSGRFVVVLGEFGTGKTFLLHELARRLSLSGAIVPLLIEMRSLEKAHRLRPLLAQHLARAGMRTINLDAFEYMLEQGKVALLFDGFDELALRVSYDRAAEHFETLIEATMGRAKVVVTSRTQHFRSGDQVTALARRLDVLPHRIAELLPFDDGQIRRFLHNRLGSDAEAEQRYALLRDVKDLLGLSENPRMLSFIVNLPEEDLRQAQGHEGTITPAALYKLLLERWLNHEYERAHPRGGQPGLSREQRWSAVTRLALRLWGQTEQWVPLAELEEEVRRALTDLDRSRLPVEVATHQVGSGTLLCRDNEGRFSFIHQSVLEWLVAAAAAAELTEGLPQALAAREMSPLMASFVADLADRQAALGWVRRVLTGVAQGAEKKNALLLLQSLRGAAGGKLELAGQDLRGMDLSAFDLRGADLGGADLRGAQLPGKSLIGAHLARSNLADADLAGADLAGADLAGADLSRASLLGADLQGAMLAGARLWRTKLLGASMPEGVDEQVELGGAALQAIALTPLRSGRLWLQAMRWSPDGELLACAAGAAIQLIEARTGRELQRLRGHAEIIRSVTFSTNGRLLASGGADGTVRLWDLHRSREIEVLRESWDWNHPVALSPNGRLLASAADGTIHIRDVIAGSSDWQEGGTIRIRTGPSKWRLGGGYGSIGALAFSPSGTMLAAACGDNSLRLWDTSSWTESTTLRGHSGSILDMAFSPTSDILASASEDQTVRLWTTDLREEPRILQGHRDIVNCIAFSPDGEIIASGAKDNTLRFWDPTSGRELRRLDSHDGSVVAVTFNPSGGELAFATLESTHIRTLPAGSEARQVEGRWEGCHTLSISPDGRYLLIGTRDGSIQLWEIPRGTRMRLLQGHVSDVWSVAIGPDGRWGVSGSSDGTVRIWDLSSGMEQHCLLGGMKSVESVAVSPDGRLVASGSVDGAIRLWDLNSGKLVRSLSGHGDSISSLVFSRPSGRYLASASKDTSIGVWEISSGKRVNSLHGHGSSVRSIALSPDGRSLASAADDWTLRLWHFRGGRELHQGATPYDVRSIAWSPDGKHLATGALEGRVSLWDAASLQGPRDLGGHDDLVRVVAFTPDGRLLASASDDNTVRLWDVAAGACVGVLASLPEGWVAYRPDGRYKFGGEVGGHFWHAINLCRFEVGELDPYVPGLRLADDEPLYDLISPPVADPRP